MLKLIEFIYNNFRKLCVVLLSKIYRGECNTKNASERTFQVSNDLYWLLSPQKNNSPELF